MFIFKKGKTAEAPKKHKSLEEVVHERILTAEGWRRRMALKNKKQK